MSDFYWSVISGLVASGLGVSIGWFVARARFARSSSHLLRLVPADGRIQIVLPSAQVPSFTIKGEGGQAEFPPNVLIMPMREGTGVARLILALRSLPRRVHIHLTTDDQVSPEYNLTVSIGGPSVNIETARILREHPQFQLRYPEHVASYGRLIFNPAKASNGDLTEDFGFLFAHPRKGGLSIVCCGVWGVGTELALSGLIDLKAGQARDVLHRRQHCFWAFHGDIEGLQVSEPKLIHVATEERRHSWPSSK